MQDEKIQLFKLKKKWPSDYSRVLKGLMFPPDWEDRILRYRDLIVVYNSRGRWSQANNQIPPAGLGQPQPPAGLAQGQGTSLGQSQGLVNAMSGLPLPTQVNKGKGVAWAQGQATGTAATVPPVPTKEQVPFQGSKKQTGATSKNNPTSKVWMIKVSNSPLSTAAASSTSSAPASTALPGAPTTTIGSAPLALKSAVPTQTTVPRHLFICLNVWVCCITATA